MSVLGIDVSKADFHAVLLADDSVAKKSFPNGAAGFRALCKWLKNRKASSVHACMEATGAYWEPLAQSLHAAGIRVSVVNPARTVFFARSQLRRTKTDAVDARMIADFCASQHPEPWSPPAPEIGTLRGFLSYRAQLVAQRTGLKQAISQIKADAALRRIHDGHIGALDDAIVALEDRIAAHVAAHERLKEAVGLMKSIPGVGLLSAVAVVAKLPVDRLRDAKAAAAYVGLTPSDRESGTSIHGKPRICRTGNADLRRDLYMPAVSAIRCNPVLRAFAERLTDRGKPAKVVIVAVMRKLIALAYTLLTKRTPFQLTACSVA